MHELLKLQGITPETPLAALTVGQAKLLFGTPQKDKSDEFAESRDEIFGLRGLMTEFHCSKSTAQRLKAGRLKPAVRQYGRLIVVDRAMARELYDK